MVISERDDIEIGENRTDIGTYYSCRAGGSVIDDSFLGFGVIGSTLIGALNSNICLIIDNALLRFLPLVHVPVTCSPRLLRQYSSVFP